MTPEAINMAMAELDGWEHLRYTGCGFVWLWGFKRRPDSPTEWAPGCVGDGRVPHWYPKELTSVAQVVEKLPAHVVSKYHNELADVCRRAGKSTIDAPPELRCEAILRATGKWED